MLAHKMQNHISRFLAGKRPTTWCFHLTAWGCHVATSDFAIFAKEPDFRLRLEEHTGGSHVGLVGVEYGEGALFGIGGVGDAVGPVPVESIVDLWS